MINRNQTVLARDASYRLKGARCHGQGRLWTAAEHAYLSAEDGVMAVSAAETALLFCDGCPVVAACAAWAEIDQYSGLAAGSVWVEGKASPLARPVEVPLAS